MGSQFNPNIARILLDNSPKYISALFDIHEIND
jgi:hypothetical protein